MGYNAIHETVVADIFDTIKDGIRIAGDVVNPKSARVRNSSSLARATSGLTLAFPVICTNTLPIETASMISKAIERKNVSMLQMAFSAYNITNAKDAVEHLSKFHKNLNLGKLDLDTFMDTMEMLGESYVYPEDIKAVTEDCKRNLNYVLDDSISESSLLEYSEVDRYGQKIVVRDPHRYIKEADEEDADDDVDNKKERNDLERVHRRQDASDSQRQQLQAMLSPSDVKKANEMQPTMMIVNFYVNDKDRDLNVAQQFVCGVKSKLYSIDTNDITNKIITKHVDSDVLLKLVKVSTREISFVKDFLLGLDEAKLNAMSKSKKGSGSRIFKALERRAIKGKIRKSLRLENSAKAISTLVISQEEAEELRKYDNIDVLQPRVIIPIMEKLNLLYFVVVDTTSEAINILTDGESEFETYSFTALEREAGDSTYKKVVNLLTKIA